MHNGGCRSSTRTGRPPSVSVEETLMHYDGPEWMTQATREGVDPREIAKAAADSKGPVSHEDVIRLLSVLDIIWDDVIDRYLDTSDPFLVDIVNRFHSAKISPVIDAMRERVSWTRLML